MLPLSHRPHDLDLCASPAGCLLFGLSSSLVRVRRVDPPLPKALPGKSSPARSGVLLTKTTHSDPHSPHLPSQAEQRVKKS